MQWTAGPSLNFLSRIRIDALIQNNKLITRKITFARWEPRQSTDAYKETRFQIMNRFAHDLLITCRLRAPSQDTHSLMWSHSDCSVDNELGDARSLAAAEQSECDHKKEWVSRVDALLK
ncbi:hypothetical protein J6590_095057 [Homalodisca vitripennis]|nr:hypothetical protein J6590_095057 [Homalodisca vitripennis]